MTLSPPLLDRVSLAGRRLDLAAPAVMGVVNVTPDSFSDGGEALAPAAAVARGVAQAEQGARLIDVGGESTRPGAAEVPLAEELRRVLPAVAGIREALRARGLEVAVSIDTRKAAVAREALAAGAELVNDVSGLADPDMAGVVAEAGAGLVIGHMRGEPATMQRDPRYQDVVAEVHAALAAARDRALAAGVDPGALLVDPGIGFGKRLADNLRLLAALGELTDLGPVVVGISRKSFLGTLLGGRPPRERVEAGLGGAVWCALAGARVIRTHDVRPTVDALGVAWAIREAGRGRLPGEDGPGVA